MKLIIVHKCVMVRSIIALIYCRLTSRHCCMANSRLVKLRVETRATFAMIFVATEVARPYAVTTRSLIVT